MNHLQVLEINVPVFIKLAKFTYKDGREVYGMVLSETPYAYFVQHSPQVYGAIYRDEIEKVEI